MATLYDDTYRGPRWRYGLVHRPISAYFIGRSGSGDIPHPILFSHRPSQDPRFPHGEAEWPCELPAEDARHHSLVLVAAPTPVTIGLCEWAMTGPDGQSYPHGIAAIQKVVGAGEMLDGIYCDSHALQARLAPYAHLVVNVRKATDGRPRLYVGRGDGQRGRFGNPFSMVIHRDGEAERLRVVAAFDRHVRDMDPAARERLLAPIREHLSETGGVLACWCAPKLCHGQVWAWWALQEP